MNDDLPTMLRAARTERGLSLERLANEMFVRHEGPTFSYIGQIERGKVPNLDPPTRDRKGGAHDGRARQTLLNLGEYLGFDPTASIEWRLADARAGLNERVVGYEAASENLARIEGLLGASTTRELRQELRRLEGSRVPVSRPPG